RVVTGPLPSTTLSENSPPERPNFQQSSERRDVLIHPTRYFDHMTPRDFPADSLHGHMAAMDDTDRLIVEALRADGRMSMRALADLIHISRASAYARVARLEREG